MTELDRAAGQLATRFPELSIVDVDAELIAAIDAVLDEGGVNPALFYEAEARGSEDPGSWSKVKRVVDRAIERVTDRLLADREPVVLRNIGLLAHFEAWKPLETLNGIAGGAGDRACLVLIPGDPVDPTFTLFRRAIPCLPSQAVVVAESWLRGVHVGAAASPN